MTARARQQREDPEQRVDLRRRGARGRRVLRAVDGVHERDQPAQPRVAQGRVPAARSSGAARRSAPTRRSSAASTLGEYAFVGAGAVVDARRASRTRWWSACRRGGSAGCASAASGCRTAAQGTCAACGVDVRARRGDAHALDGDPLRRGTSAMTRRTVRIALVGCGRISRNHFDAIAQIDGLELVAVCDIVDATRARGGRASTACRGSRRTTRCSRDVPMRRRRDLHAVRAASAARHPRGARREARDLREADGDLARRGGRAGRRPATTRASSCSSSSRTG